MYRLFAATAAIAFIVAPAFAQSSSVQTGNDTQLRTQQTGMNDVDAGLPGGADNDSNLDTGTTGSITTDNAEVKTDRSALPSGEPAVNDQMMMDRKDDTTPSGGVVPGQNPE